MLFDLNEKSYDDNTINLYLMLHVIKISEFLTMKDSSINFE